MNINKISASIRDGTRRDRLPVSDGFNLRTEDSGDCYFSKPHMFIDMFEKKKVDLSLCYLEAVNVFVYPQYPRFWGKGA